MSIWDDVTRVDAVMAFSDPDGIGAESIVYTPSGAAARTFYANVNRELPSEIAGGAKTAGVQITVFVPYSTDATKGISAAPNIGGDTITVAEKVGGTANERHVAAIVDQDSGGWTVKLR